LPPRFIGDVHFSGMHPFGYSLERQSDSPSNTEGQIEEAKTLLRDTFEGNNSPRVIERAFVASRSPLASVRCLAARVMVRLVDVDDRALPALVVLLKDPDSNVEWAAWEAVADVGAKARPKLDEILVLAANARCQPVAWAAIDKIDWQEACRLKMEALIKEWPSRKGNDSANQDLAPVRKLVAELGNQDFEVRERASLELVKQGIALLPVLAKEKEHIRDPEALLRLKNVMVRVTENCGL